MAEVYILCPYCGGRLEVGAAGCKHCHREFVSAEPQKPKGRHCTSCGAVLEAGQRFCHSCGAEVPVPTVTKYICPDCGNEAKDGQKFCPLCGAAFETREIPLAEPEVKKEVPKEKKLTRLQWLDRHLTSTAKGWVKAMPILTAIFAGLGIVLSLILMFVLERAASVWSLLEYSGQLALSVATIKTKKTGLYIAFAAYAVIGLIVAVLASYDFSNIAWIAGYIYCSIKLYKQDQKYAEYLATGEEPPRPVNINKPQ